MGGFYYNTNGFAFHRLEDVVRILGELGYDGIALTPDVHHLDPFHSTAADLSAFRSACEAAGLGIVLETGARFVLDADRKHRPTLLDDEAGAARRLDFLQRCVDMAAALGAPVVTIWSGASPDGLEPERARERLVRCVRALCVYAAERSVRIGFEPEPGMLIEEARHWREVRDAVAHESLGLTLDVGHCLATNEGAPAAVIEEYAADLLVLQLDDHRPGVHDHLAFGEGEIDFTAVAAAVSRCGFDGPLEVELSRHSATAPTTARTSLEFLRAAFASA